MYYTPEYLARACGILPDGTTWAELYSRPLPLWKRTRGGRMRRKHKRFQGLIPLAGRFDFELFAFNPIHEELLNTISKMQRIYQDDPRLDYYR